LLRAVWRALQDVAEGGRRGRRIAAEEGRLAEGEAHRVRQGRPRLEGAQRLGESGRQVGRGLGEENDAVQVLRSQLRMGRDDLFVVLQRLGELLQLETGLGGADAASR